MATTVELSKELARRRAKNATTLDTENVVFFDVLGLFMVCTSDSICLVLEYAENTAFQPVLHIVLQNWHLSRDQRQIAACFY